MAKRSIDSNLFAKDWFLELDSKYQIFYIYMFTHADCAGVFDPNLKTISRILNFEYTKESVFENLNDQVIEINGKWLLTKFFKHQYNNNPSPTMIKPINAALSKIGLKIEDLKNIDTLSIGYRYSHKDKDKDKDKDNNKDKGINREESEEGEFTPAYVVESPDPKPEKKLDYFEMVASQFLPLEYLDTWKEFVDTQAAQGITLNRHTVKPSLEIFRECDLRGISPPVLLKAFQASGHKGLQFIAEHLIKEKEKGNGRNSNNGKGGATPDELAAIVARRRAREEAKK